MDENANRGGNPESTWRSLADWDTPAGATPASAAPEVPASPPLQEWGALGGNGGKHRRLSRPRGKVLVAIGLVIALAAGAFVYLSMGRSPGTTALAFSLSPGSTRRYSLHLKMDGKLTVQKRTLPFTMDMDETFSWKVESVDSQGVATVDMKVEKISGTVAGQPIPSTGSLTTKIKIAKDGRILTAGQLAPAGGSSFSQLPGSDQLTPLLPANPVKPGETWAKSFSQAFPLGSGSINYTTVNKFERNETVGGVNTVVIHTSMTAPLNIVMDFRKVLALSGLDRQLPRNVHPTITYGGRVTSNQTSWFDPKAGHMVKGSGLGRFDLSMRFKGFPAGLGQPQGAIGFAGTMNFSIDRLAA